MNIQYKQTLKDISIGNEKWSEYINRYGDRWKILIFDLFFLLLSLVRVSVMESNDGYIGIVVFSIALIFLYFQSFYVVQYRDTMQLFEIDLDEDNININNNMFKIKKYYNFLEINYILIFFSNKFIAININDVPNFENENFIRKVSEY